MNKYHLNLLKGLSKLEDKIESMSSEEFDIWWEKHKPTDEDAKKYAMLEKEIIKDSKLDVSSKKSLREHDIEYTADGFRLDNADVLVKSAGKDLFDWLVEKNIIRLDSK